MRKLTKWLHPDVWFLIGSFVFLSLFGAVSTSTAHHAPQQATPPVWIPTIYLGTSGFTYKQAQNLCHAHHGVGAIEFDDQEVALFVTCRDRKKLLIWAYTGALPPMKKI